MIWAKPGDAQDFLAGGLYSDFADAAAQRLIQLAEQVARSGMLALELGCYTGWTATRVLPVIAKNGGHFYCLDWFRGSIDTKVGEWRWPDQPADKVLSQTLKNLELTGYLDNVTLIVGNSNAVELFRPTSFDYIYVGGDHRYTPAKRDIQMAKQLIRPGGVIVGHGFEGPMDPARRDAIYELIDLSELDFYSDYSSHLGLIRAVEEELLGYAHGHNLFWWFKGVL